MNLLTDLLNTEETITKCYSFLAKFESNGIGADVSKQVLKKIIQNLNYQEIKILGSFSQDMKWAIKKYLQGQIIVSTSINRIVYLLEAISGDDGIKYAHILYYDIHKIIMKFLDTMISDAYFENIRKILIEYKYNLISIDYYLENDFLNPSNNKKIKLNQREDYVDLPSTRFIDQAVLVGESLDAIKYLALINFDFNNTYNQRALVVIQIINILARLALCNENDLFLIKDDFNKIYNSEEENNYVKELMGRLAFMFEKFQDDFYFSR